jgi:hypothetical protein
MTFIGRIVIAIAVFMVIRELRKPGPRNPLGILFKNTGKVAPPVWL